MEAIDGRVQDALAVTSSNFHAPAANSFRLGMISGSPPNAERLSARRVSSMTKTRSRPFASEDTAAGIGESEGSEGLLVDHNSLLISGTDLKNA